MKVTWGWLADWVDLPPTPEALAHALAMRGFPVASIEQRVSLDPAIIVGRVLEASPHTAQTRHPSVVGKWGIDATKPVPYRAAERANFERAWPIGWNQVKLEDYLERD